MTFNADAGPNEGTLSAGSVHEWIYSSGGLTEITITLTTRAQIEFTLLKSSGEAYVPSTAINELEDGTTVYTYSYYVLTSNPLDGKFIMRIESTSGGRYSFTIDVLQPAG
jgi:hypothetical protein